MIITTQKSNVKPIHTNISKRRKKKSAHTVDPTAPKNHICSPFHEGYSPVGTLLPSLTLSLHPEGADVWPVPLVVWSGPGKFQQHITRAGSFT